MPTRDDLPPSSPTTSDASDSDLYNTESARVYFGPVKTPERNFTVRSTRHFLPSDVPARRQSARLSKAQSSSKSTSEDDTSDDADDMAQVARIVSDPQQEQQEDKEVEEKVEERSRVEQSEFLVPDGAWRRSQPCLPLADCPKKNPHLLWQTRLC